MSAEERTLMAIKLTRLILKRALGDQATLVQMAVNDVAPDDVENVVAEILEYLDKTEKEEG
jgi:type III secretion system FlhB-like substrate exporter